MKNIGLQLFKKPEMYTVELTTSSFKLACLKTSANRQELVCLACKTIGGLPDAEVTKAVAALVKEFHVQRGQVFLVVPATMVITKNYEVMATDPQQIRQIINLEAVRNSPFSKEEIIVDYLPIGVFKQHYTKVQLFIVNKTAVNRQFVILENAGLQIEKVLLGQEAVGIMAPKLLGLSPGADTLAPQGIISIDENHTEFSVVKGNKPVYLRAFPLGALALAGDKEKSTVKFAEELKKSLETYQAENIDAAPESLVFLGSQPQLADFQPAPAADSSALPIKSLSFIKGLALSSQASVTLERSKTVSFLNVVLALQVQPQLKINLIPEDIKLKRLLRQRARDLILTGLISLGLVFVLFAYFMFVYALKLDYADRLSRTYKTTQEEAGKLAGEIKRLEFVKAYQASRGTALLVLMELYEVSPVNLELNDIRFEREGKFTVRGTGDSMSTVFAFTDGLSKSRFLKDVKTRNTTKRNDGKQDVYDFEVNAVVSSVEKGKESR